MLHKVTNQQVLIKPQSVKTSSKHEKRIIPIDGHEFSYVRFRAIGCMEWPDSGPNGNWDGFPYQYFEDNKPGYGYKSFIGKRAHYEHNSSTGIRGSIGDLPDSFLNSFVWPSDVDLSVTSSFQNKPIPGKIIRWSDLLSRKYDDIREKILMSPNQRDGSIEVLMRIDRTLAKQGSSILPEVRSALDRIIRTIDTGGRLSCSMGCFLPGTQIQLPDGTYAYIEDLQRGDNIVSHKGLTREIIETMVRPYNGNIYKISVVGQQRPLQLTPEHPILIRKAKPFCVCGCGERVHYKDRTFLSGHHQNVYNSHSKNLLTKDQKNQKREELIRDRDNQLEWVDAKDVEKGDYVAYPISNEEIEVPYISKGKARLIGYFLAGGSFIKYTPKNGDTYKTGIAFSFGGTEKDLPFIKEVQDLLLSEFNISAACYSSLDYADKEEYESRYKSKFNYGCTELRALSKEVANFFEQYCGEYAISKQLLSEVMVWPKDLQRHLLGAYFNGDGTQSIREESNSIAAVTISEKLGYQLLYLLKRIGVPASLNRQFFEYQKHPTYTLNIRGHYQNLLKEYWSYIEVKESNFSNGQKSLSRYKLSNDYILFPVTNIETFLYDGPVYNFAVEEDNSYIANGVSVHNCNVDFSDCSSCGNRAYFSEQYCNHVRNRKGSIEIVRANDIRDLLDKELLRPEWLKHTVASKYDINEILNGQSNKGVAVRNVEINHGTSFFELSVVGRPAFLRGEQLEKIARKQDEAQIDYLNRLRKDIGDDTIMEIYSILQQEGKISSACQIS